METLIREFGDFQIIQKQNGDYYWQGTGDRAGMDSSTGYASPEDAWNAAVDAFEDFDVSQNFQGPDAIRTYFRNFALSAACSLIGLLLTSGLIYQVEIFTTAQETAQHSISPS
ncbi:MAG: hypothetical protein AAGB19_13755 [Cyanobacteria bacterium P01_F01_bin.3]